MTTMNERNPQPGDLIEIFLPNGLSHWAVFIGDGYVVHLTTVENGISGSSGISGISGISGSGPGLHNKKGIVLKETLKDAVQDKEWKINNSLDDKYKPRDARIIVKKALSLAGTKHKYDLLVYNCEHFATELRYDQGESRQVRNGVLAAAAGAATGAAVGVALAGAISGGYSKEKKNTR